MNIIHPLTFIDRLVIGGAWDPPMSPLESRREAMLNLFGKAKPFTMGPALQIDGHNARLLVEALSGRWDYDQDRRDKRTVWYYVANAFSLCVDRIAPEAPSGGDDFDVITAEGEVRRAGGLRGEEGILNGWRHPRLR